MSDRPILFSAPMVRALLDGRKTQTRRVLKRPTWAQTEGWPERIMDEQELDGLLWWFARETGCLSLLPIPQPGDRLWVRESWQSNGLNWGKQIKDMRLGAGPIHYMATDKGEWQSYWGGWKPSIHMPRWASRLTLTVTDVRVQRVQDISGTDSMAEGVECHTCAAMKQSACNGKGCFASVCDFRNLWDSINAKRGYGWDVNPWVCAITFDVHKCNIDQMGAAT